MQLTLPKVGKRSPSGLSKLRARFEGSNLLALECSWSRWKGIEVKMSKMALHEPFGNLQPKLWEKEGPGVKLAV